MIPGYLNDDNIIKIKKLHIYLCVTYQQTYRLNMTLIQVLMTR